MSIRNTFVFDFNTHFLSCKSKNLARKEETYNVILDRSWHFLCHEKLVLRGAYVDSKNIHTVSWYQEYRVFVYDEITNKNYMRCPSTKIIYGNPT